MNRILIIGANGFIGKPTLKAIRERFQGDEIHATYRNTTPAESEDVVWYPINVLEEGAVKQLFKLIQPTHLVQLAWCTEHGVYWKDTANLEWIQANLLIAQEFVRYNGQRCVFLGTCAEYDWSTNQAFKEDTAILRPNSLYGASKLASFWALGKYLEQENVSWSWGRIFNPFGPHENPKRLLPKICNRLIQGERISFDAGTQIRDFLHISEIGNALSLLLASEINGAINIASGQGITIQAVLRLMATSLGKSDSITFDPPAGSENLDLVVADVARLKAELGWQAQKTLEERIAETCQWWKELSLQEKIT